MAVDHGFGGNDGAWWVRERGSTVQLLRSSVHHPLTVLGYIVLLEALVARHTFRLPRV